MNREPAPPSRNGRVRESISESASAPICVIGAGCSGLVTLRALLDAGISCQAYELGSRVGGLWVFQNDNGRSAAYRSLRINTSARAMELTGFAWPPGTQDYPRHDQVADYFASYAERFGLAEHIAFRTEVLSCVPVATGGYEVSTRDLSTAETQTRWFAGVVVANGHHWSKTLPKPLPTGEFAGAILHSHDYVDPTTPIELRTKRVLVVGMGNSAVDIASELAARGEAEQVLLSARRGVWVIPKYIRGKPADQGHVIPRWLPAKFRRRVVTRAFTLLFGRMRDHGLPEPDHLIGEAHPTLSSELPSLVQSGAIGMRPAIREFAGKHVVFDDGRADEVDAIVFATGYQVKFPFLAEEHVAAPDNRLSLFRRVFHPCHRRLFFVGLAQPLGAIMPIAELQAQWIAEHLAGRYSLPEHETLLADIERDEEAVRSRYVASPRHTMQIEPEAYTAAVRRELRLGARRARRGLGMAFPASPAPSS